MKNTQGFQSVLNKNTELYYNYLPQIMETTDLLARDFEILEKNVYKVRELD